MLRVTAPDPAKVRPSEPVISEEIVALPLSQTTPWLLPKANVPPLIALPFENETGVVGAVADRQRVLEPSEIV